MKCPACGAEAHGKFCEICGSPLQAKPETAARPAHGQQAASDPLPEQGQRQYQQAQTPRQGDDTGNRQGWQQAPYNPVAGGAPATGASQQRQGSGAPFVLAIIALVTALLGLFPVSLVLAIIALVMNSGQRKRGETSTKQTPTFVMALISLILSIIAAILTAFVGGILWLGFLADDEDDLRSFGSAIVQSSSTAHEEPSSSIASGESSSGTEPSTSASASTAESAVVGTWEAISVDEDGENYGKEYLDLMRSYGVNVELVVKSDGTASLDLLDESESGTWKDRGDGTIEFAFDGDIATGTLSGDELTLTDDEDFDEKVVFERSASQASKQPESSDSESSSPAAPGSSESDTKAPPAPLDAEETPTLGDFQWMTGEMFSGKVPADASPVTDYTDLEGRWKAYAFGSGMERFYNVTFSGDDDDAVVTFEWFYVIDGSTGDGSDDDTPDSTFQGTWDDGYLDAVGASGRVDITDAWQDGSRQYAVGSFMWPSGEIDDIALVRP